MATCNGRIDVGRYAIEIKFVHIDRLADAIINQTLYCLSWYNNRLSTAVYNFMQTQKERKPCKIKASATNKKGARRRTRSGGPRTARTGAERRHRTFEPWQGSKKERYRFGIVLFSSARRGSKPFPPLQGFSNGLPVETLQRGEVDLSASLAIMFLSCQKLGSRRRRQYYPQLLRHETLYHNPLILSMFLHVSLVL